MMQVKEMYAAGSCALGGLISISTVKGPETVIDEFCKKAILIKPTPWCKDPKPGFCKSCTYYVFTAGPEQNSAYKLYGTRLAAYIEANKLGDITTLAARKNRKYHPTTNCQAWLWAPDQERLEEWYSKAETRIKEGEYPTAVQTVYKKPRKPRVKKVKSEGDVVVGEEVVF